MRSVLAVVAGFVTMVAATATFFSFIIFVALGGMPSDPKKFSPPVWLYVVELSATPILAGAGGYVCAWIAQRLPMRHAYVLALATLIMTIVSMSSPSGEDPWWHMPALGILGIAGTLAGARVRIAHRDAIA